MAWTAVAGSCGDLQTFRGALRLSGRVAGQRVPGLMVGLAIDGDRALAMEARIVDRPVFTLAGVADRATLWISDGNRVVTASVEDLLDALVGVRLSPARLRALLSGCAAVDRRFVSGERLGDLLKVLTPDSAIYMVNARAWRVRAAEFDGFVVDYREMSGTMPRVMSLVSGSGRTPAVSLTLAIRDAERNPALAPALFVPVEMDGAVAASLEELRASGPLSR